MRNLLQTSLALAAAAGLAGCGAVGSSNAANDLAQTLTVYSSLPLQGPDHTRQQSIVNGEKLALAQAGGHVGPFHVSIASLDDADPSRGSWTPDIASQAARQAAQDKTTIAYIGDFDSGATAISLPLINEANILQISPASGYVGLTRAGTDAGKGEPDRYYPSGVRTFARLMPADDVQARAVLGYLRSLRVRRLALATDLDVFDSQVAELVASQARGAGIKVVAATQLDLSPAAGGSHSTEVSQLAAVRPDAVLVGAAPGPGVAQLWRAVNAAIPRAKLIAPNALATPSFLASLSARERSASYVVSPVLELRSYPPAAQRLARDYQQQFGAPATPYALYGYEAMRAALASVRAAGKHGADRLSVVRAFFRLGTRDSVLGRYSVAPTGDISLRAFAGYRVGPGGVLRLQRKLN